MDGVNSPAFASINDPKGTLRILLVERWSSGVAIYWEVVRERLSELSTGLLMEIGKSEPPLFSVWMDGTTPLDSGETIGAGSTGRLIGRIEFAGDIDRQPLELRVRWRDPISLFTLPES
jgi:hypothetical protein